MLVRFLRAICQNNNLDAGRERGQRLLGADILTENPPTGGSVTNFLCAQHPEDAVVATASSFHMAGKEAAALRQDDLLSLLKGVGSSGGLKRLTG